MGTQAPEITNTKTDKAFGTIESTKNYTKFRYMAGNRTVDVKHVKGLQAQMQRNPNMFASMPILVNENWYIVDGQHRFEAAKALDIPIYYIRQRQVGLSDARQLNIAQKRWGMLDFAKSYADSGRADYIELLRIKKQYPRISLSVVAGYLAGIRSSGNFSDRFRRGEYQIVNKEDGVSALDILAKIIGLTRRPATNAFAAALWQALHHDDFDEIEFLRKLEENPDNLSMMTSTRAALRNIEDIFNRYNKVAKRLY